jgi:hypothetical protein
LDQRRKLEAAAYLVDDLFLAQVIDHGLVSSVIWFG